MRSLDAHYTTTGHFLHVSNEKRIPSPAFSGVIFFVLYYPAGLQHFAFSSRMYLVGPTFSGPHF